MPRTAVCLFFFATLLAGPARSQEPNEAVSRAAELLGREEARAVVAAALELATAPAPGGDLANDNVVRAVEDVARFGPGAVPFLVYELEQAREDSFHFCAYALGLVKTPESEAALRRAVAAADGIGGDFAAYRKAWSGWALALQGAEDAVDLFDAGKRQVASVPIHGDTSAIEAAAVQTAPACVPRLTAQLERQAADPDDNDREVWVLRALRRVGDPAVAPQIGALFDTAKRRIRIEAARTLGYVHGPAAIDALLVKGLTDEDSAVRATAATALRRQRPRDRTTAVLARLDEETDSLTRGMLYGALAAGDDPAALDRLRAVWGRPADADERLGLVDAAAAHPLPGRIELLTRSLRDPDLRVAVRAADALAWIPEPAARDVLLAAIGHPKWSVARVAVTRLAERRDAAAAPRIAERLLRLALPRAESESAARSQVESLGQALVELGYAAPLDGIRESLTRQRDGITAELVASFAQRLELIGRLGASTTAWVELLDDDDTERRRLAYTQLGRIGTGKALRRLAAAFDTVPDDADREAILYALRDHDAGPVLALFERVLTDPAFDTPPRWAQRDLAAWGAARSGTRRGLSALATAVERREGRDAKVCVYYALAGGATAAADLRRFRAPRMVYIKWSRGREQRLLDEIVRDIADGRSLARFDVPPDAIRFD